MNYSILQQPESIATKNAKGKIVKVKAFCSFTYCNICKAHFVEDDHCYKLAIYAGEYNGKRLYKYTTYLFPEAIDVLKTMPTPKY